MSSNKSSVVIKHPDGSSLVVEVVNISDPKLKAEMKKLISNLSLKVNGNIIKKIVTN